ncbi:MAG: Clathrin/coatomer adaptor, adaptin-like protein [Podila humilis]|nr:MAG: Clathrin/coatomer adaptor, adaptin-like protein [Podila humilis]
MDLSRKLLSTLTGNHTQQEQRQEDAYSEESLAQLRSSISNPSTSTSTMKDNMLRLIYGEMMGQDVQFGAIYALKLAQSGQTVAEKRAGYLACYLLLQEGNELNIMLINTLQKDLASSNYHHVVVALVTLSNMMLPDVIPSVIGHVLAALSHTHESVRKRALIVLKSFYVQQPELVAPYLSQIRECLYDHEPSVMSAALGFFVVVVKNHEHAKDMKGMVPVLIKILQQVVDGKLPKGYSYHGTPAPWIQIRCLQIMAQLGHDDLSASSTMTPVVLLTFHKARQGVDAAFGILFEVIKTLNCFHLDIILELVQSRDVAQNPLLVISKFATASNQNLKYLGIAMLCQVHPTAWSDTWWNDQLLAGVVEALDSRDKTIQRKALDLLYRMLTYENSENIIDRLVHAFYQEQAPPTTHGNYHTEIDGTDVLSRAQSKTLVQDASSSSSSSKSPHRQRHYRTHQEKILAQILDASERFGKSEGWYVDLIFDLLQAGAVVTMRIAEKFMRVFEHGPASPAFSVDYLRPLAVQKALDVMEQANYLLDQRSLAYFALWVLGEYADATKGGPTSIMVVLSRCLVMNQDPLVVAWTLTALTKVVLRIASPVPEVITYLVRSTVLGAASYDASYPTSMVMDAQQRAQEFLLVAEMAS